MKQINKEVKHITSKPSLSSVSVDQDGKLIYSTPAWKKVAHRALNDLPIICWYISVVMVGVFILSVWSIAHRHVTTTHHSEVAVYWFLILYSLAIVAGMIGLSYYFYKNNAVNNNQK